MPVTLEITEDIIEEIANRIQDLSNGFRSLFAEDMNYELDVGEVVYHGLDKSKSYTDQLNNLIEAAAMATAMAARVKLLNNLSKNPPIIIFKISTYQGILQQNAISVDDNHAIVGPKLLELAGEHEPISGRIETKFFKDAKTALNWQIRSLIFALNNDISIVSANDTELNLKSVFAQLEALEKGKIRIPRASPYEF